MGTMSRGEFELALGPVNLTPHQINRCWELYLKFGEDFLNCWELFTRHFNPTVLEMGKDLAKKNIDQITWHSFFEPSGPLERMIAGGRENDYDAIGKPMSWFRENAIEEGFDNVVYIIMGFVAEMKRKNIYGEPDPDSTTLGDANV